MFQTGSDVQPRKGATHFEPSYLTLPEALAVSASGGARSSSLGGAAPRCTASAPTLLSCAAHKLNVGTEATDPPMKPIAKHIGMGLPISGDA